MRPYGSFAFRYPASLFFMMMVFLLVSCNDESTNRVRTDTIALNPPDSAMIDQPITNCYIQVLQRDTFMARLQQDGKNISGQLVFDNYQKDGSRGTVTGTIENGVARLKYFFASEGTNSVMDVYFKVFQDSIVRGIGDMSTSGDTAYFINPEKITYTGSVLKKTDCNQLKGL